MPVRAAVAVLAVWAASLVASVASASIDGAGLFVPPADRSVAARRYDPPSPAPVRRRLVTQVRALLPTLERLRSFAVTPTMLGSGGIGVRISGKM